MDTERGVPRRPDEVRYTPPHGIPARATPTDGTPIHSGTSARPGGGPGAPIPPGAPTRPIVHAPSATGPQARVDPYATGPQEAADPRDTPEEAAWEAVPEAQNAYVDRDVPPSSTTGPIGPRVTSGVQVRIASREPERGRRRARTPGGRGGLIAAGVLALAGLVTAGLFLTRGTGDGGTDPDPSARKSAGGTATAGGGGTGRVLPRAGSPIEVGTADGARYRIATVAGGVNDGVVTTSQSTPPSGTSFAYIEYLLSNPTRKKVLLDYPGDVFLRRDLIAPEARGRCMPQAGVPEEMCTPPTHSRVIRRLRGGDLTPGEGGDKYMAPGGTYLVRATVDVPVRRNITRKDMGLYVWKQLYMADRLAKQAPFPR